MSTTIAQTTAANQATAQRNQAMNAPNQLNPYGTISTTTGPNGQPQYTWQFSPGEESLYNSFTANRNATSPVTGGAISNVARDVNAGPIDTSTTGNYLTNLARQRLDPILERQRAAKEQQLFSYGAQPGTEAWKNAQTDLGRQENDAYNQLLLQGEGQAYNQLQGQRTANLGTLASLFGYGAPQTPQSAAINQPQYNEQPVNVAGITDQAYQNSLLPWQSQNQYNQALMGGLFGLGGAALGSAGRAAGAKLG